MPYLNCPRCGLSIRIQSVSLAMSSCPRCLARTHQTVALELAEKPAHTSTRPGAGSSARGQRHASSDRTVSPRPGEDAPG
jgi:hypothetical protein